MAWSKLTALGEPGFVSFTVIADDSLKKNAEAGFDRCIISPPKCRRLAKSRLLQSGSLRFGS